MKELFLNYFLEFPLEEVCVLLLQRERWGQLYVCSFAMCIPWLTLSWNTGHVPELFRKHYVKFNIYRVLTRCE